MARLPMRGTVRAEMRPDCYGGKTCDRIVPRWNVYAEGDKQDEDTHAPLTLAARAFPPGTTVVVAEPTCPDCGELRPLKYLKPKRGPLFESRCACGFDWDEWTLTEFS